MFFDWPDCFYPGGLGDNLDVSGKLSMKLAKVKICFGCSKEPSHRDGSFEHTQHMFPLRNKKKFLITHSEGLQTV